MKIENQVSNLELSRKLKELGVKQESLFEWAEKGWYERDKWNRCKKLENVVILKSDSLKREMDGGLETAYNTIYSAFTVAELGEMLPENYFTYREKNLVYGAWFDEKAKDVSAILRVYSCDRTEANARAKMLIYLLEKKLLPLNNKSPNQ